MNKRFIKGKKKVKREDPINKLPFRNLEAQIAKLLRPFGDSDVRFTYEETMKLNVLFYYYQDQKEEPKFYHFSVFTFGGKVGVNFNDHMSWDLTYFPIEFTRKVLKILKAKKKIQKMCQNGKNPTNLI